MNQNLIEALETAADYIRDAISDRINTYPATFRPEVLENMKMDLKLVEEQLAIAASAADPSPILSQSPEESAPSAPKS